MSRTSKLTVAQLKKLQTEHPHEIFAVTLLACTPSALGRAWTNNGSLAKAKKELAKLPLSDDMKKYASQFMQDFAGVKSFYKGIADMQSAAYAGPEPHPHIEQAKAIVKALRSLDPK